MLNKDTMVAGIKEVSIQDVARHCGVSVATVSHVINRKPVVRQEKVALIRQAIDELGYKPKPPGRRQGMRSRSNKILRRSNRIALVTFGMLKSVFSSPVYTSVLQGIQEGVQASGKTLNIIDIKQISDLPQDSIKGVYDGLIVFGTTGDERLRRRLSQSHCVRIMGTVDNDNQWDHITYNNSRIGVIAAEYLLARGHRHCAIIGDLSGRSVSFRDTLKRKKGVYSEYSGYESVVSETENRIDRESMSKVLDKLLSAKPRPSGLFCPADMITAAVYPLLYEKGVVPGKDVELVSCNNEGILLANLHPRPATVDIHARAVGRRAVEQLNWRFEHPNDAIVKTELEPELVTGVNEKIELKKFTTNRH
jgi:DNA-binding LacI/PurR family transcriptional regulator